MKTAHLVRFTLAIGFAVTSGMTLPAGETPPAPPPAPSAADLRAYIELVRSDLETQKAVVIAQNMEFTEAEASEFWPLHREYETAVARWADRRLALIHEFLKNRDTLSETGAQSLAAQFFALERDRTKLKEDWFAKFLTVIPAKKAVRFFQIENQLNAAIDLRLAAATPLLH
jgi:hypothetical protein